MSSGGGEFAVYGCLVIRSVLVHRLKVRKDRLLPSSGQNTTPKNREREGWSEMMEFNYLNIRRRIPEDHNVHTFSYGLEAVKSVNIRCY